MFINSISRNNDELSTWLIDAAGNVAISDFGLALLNRIQKLGVPVFISTEEAMAWGSGLNPEQRETLFDVHRTLSNAALAEDDLQRKVNLATQSQLIREAAETLPGSASGRRRPGLCGEALPPNRTGERN